MRERISLRGVVVEGERNCVSKSGRASAFPAQHVRYGEKGGGASGSSPWNFNQRQLLAEVARSPYVRTFLETQNSIFPPFSPLSRSFLLRVESTWLRERRRRRRCCKKKDNRRVLPRDTRRLILSPKHIPFPIASRLSRGPAGS